LVVEDDLALQKQIKWSLDGYESVLANDRESAMAQLRRHGSPVVTMDLGLPRMRTRCPRASSCWNRYWRRRQTPKSSCSRGRTAGERTQAVAMGAYDFLAALEPEVLNLCVERAFRMHEPQAENKRLQALQASDAIAGLITRDPQMLRVCRTIEKVANTNASVMLLGESGTGKEVLAWGLHQQSNRSNGSFVAINCAAIPENLLESELFGYEKGAFTGAAKTTPGKIETAHGGTLMLDEIGDMPMPLQAKLLRFLQERVVERVGGRQGIADVRVVVPRTRTWRNASRMGAFAKICITAWPKSWSRYHRCVSGWAMRRCWPMPLPAVLHRSMDAA
jgi:two-component system NtrC family response regulator